MRDPRKDPKAGDMTTNSDVTGKNVYVVVGRCCHTVFYMANGQPEETPIEDWIRFSKDDEVLHATE